VQAYLAGTDEPILRNLYLIGQPEDPYSIWLTDHPSSLTYSFWGVFNAAKVTRGSVTSKIGLEVTTLDITWAPKQPRTFGVTTATSNPMQLAQLGFYDNWPVRVWTAFLPGPGGDCNTLGACELFGGIVGDTVVNRDGIKWTVNSMLYVCDTDIPPNTIEATNTLASFLGAIPPAGLTVVPTFEVAGVGESTTSFSASCLGPTGGQIFSNNAFQQGFLVFTSGTLEGFWSAVAANYSGGGYNIFQVYTPFPWPPSAGDEFYVSAKSPIDQSDIAIAFPFPYVPDPSQAV
jgi:hypothetical protein